MVVLMLDVNGFDVIDIGVDVEPREIINRAKEDKVDIGYFCISPQKGIVQSDHKREIRGTRYSPRVL